jgi:hypothetical protein
MPHNKMPKTNEDADLHGRCDFVLKNFEIRQTARDQEVKALKQAKAPWSFSIWQCDYCLKNHRHLTKDSLSCWACWRCRLEQEAEQQPEEQQPEESSSPRSIQQEEKLTEKQEEEKHRDELEWNWFGARIGAADLQNSCDWDLEENLTEASETVTEALSRPPPSPPRGLSAPWAAEWDPHHEDYYFWNEETGATTWEKPDWVK